MVPHFVVRIWVILCCLENLRERVLELPVPQTDTGGQVENTKAIEIIMVKELGKILP